MRWKYHPGCDIQAPLYSCGHYVISCRPREFNVAYRPPGTHIHVARNTALRLAKQSAKMHAEALAKILG